jgi:hypothetical protein
MEIEQQLLRQNSDEGPLLEVHLYVTSAQSPADLKALNVYLSLDLIGRENSASCNAIDELRQRTKHGRPDWEQVKIGLFYSNNFLSYTCSFSILSENSLTLINIKHSYVNK